MKKKGGVNSIYDVALIFIWVLAVFKNTYFFLFSSPAQISVENWRDIMYSSNNRIIITITTTTTIII
jgi:hypothetical protein